MLRWDRFQAPAGEANAPFALHAALHHAESRLGAAPGPRVAVGVRRRCCAPVPVCSTKRRRPTSGTTRSSTTGRRAPSRTRFSPSTPNAPAFPNVFNFLPGATLPAIPSIFAVTPGFQERLHHQYQRPDRAAVDAERQDSSLGYVNTGARDLGYRAQYEPDQSDRVRWPMAGRSSPRRSMRTRGCFRNSTASRCRTSARFPTTTRWW